MTDFVDTLNDAERARFDALADAYRERFAADGVELTAAGLAQVPSIRLAALLGEAYTLDEQTAQREIRALPAVGEALRRAEVREAMERGEADALAEVNSLPPAARMERARELGLTGRKAAEKPQYSAEEEAARYRALAEIRSPTAPPSRCACVGAGVMALDLDQMAREIAASGKAPAAFIRKAGQDYRHANGAVLTFQQYLDLLAKVGRLHPPADCVSRRIRNRTHLAADRRDED